MSGSPFSGRPFLPETLPGLREEAEARARMLYELMCDARLERRAHMGPTRAFPRWDRIPREERDDWTAAHFAALRDLLLPDAMLWAMGWLAATLHTRTGIEVHCQRHCTGIQWYLGSGDLWILNTGDALFSFGDEANFTARDALWFGDRFGQPRRDFVVAGLRDLPDTEDGRASALAAACIAVAGGATPKPGPEEERP